jgi:hypothetical protein
MIGLEAMASKSSQRSENESHQTEATKETIEMNYAPQLRQHFHSHLKSRFTMFLRYALSSGVHYLKRFIWLYDITNSNSL